MLFARRCDGIGEDVSLPRRDILVDRVGTLKVDIRYIEGYRYVK